MILIDVENLASDTISQDRRSICDHHHHRNMHKYCNCFLPSDLISPVPAVSERMASHAEASTSGNITTAWLGFILYNGKMQDAGVAEQACECRFWAIW